MQNRRYGVFTGSEFSELEMFIRLMRCFVFDSADGTVESAPTWSRRLREGMVGLE